MSRHSTGMWICFFFFSFLSLGFLTFKNNFHLTRWWGCLPALHSLSQIYFLGIPSGRLRLFTDQLFQAHDLQRPLHFLFSEFPAPSISNLSWEDGGHPQPTSWTPPPCAEGLFAAHCVLYYISEAGSTVPHRLHHHLFRCVLDPASSHLLRNLLSHFQVCTQANV